MFSVIISEKGGAERRETFDRTEINVGRVQGNDLMLPKGNVSKRHARLLYRDGRFIVTDLKSTNGTYVNGRKIAQATIVREGDKIYIGDFVLRIETASAAGPSISDSPAPQRPTHEDAPPEPPATPAPPGVVAPPELVALSPPSSAGKGPSPRVTPQILPERFDPARTGGQVISHFPLENDPDDSSGEAVVPAPPRVPSPRPPIAPPALVSAPSPVPAAPAIPITPPTPPVAAVRPAAPPPPPVPARALSSSGSSPAFAATSTGITNAPTAAAGRGANEAASGAASPKPAPASVRGTPPLDGAQAATRRRTLTRLMERLREGQDLAPLDGGAAVGEALARRIDSRLADCVATMRSSSELAAEIDADALIAEARRELFQLGPIGPLLEDEDVSEVQVFHHDYVVAVQGRRLVPSDAAFSSEAALARVIRRLCAAAGQPLGDGEAFVERRLPQGYRLFAVLPPASNHGHTLVVRKPQRADLTLEDLVRSGTISRAMEGLLSQCVAARGNILITGTRGSGTTSMLGALAAAGRADDRVVVLQEEDELILNQPHTVSILLGDTAEAGARALQAAARIQPDRLIVGSFAGHVAAEVVDAIGDGVDGVLAAARAPTLRQAVARITADLAATKQGLFPETAREWLAAAFDLVIEIARLRDGRHRVLRIAELGVEGGAIVIRDVFTFNVERTAAGGALEGTFHPTGHIPGIAEDLSARGTPLDNSSFRRTR